MDTGEGADQIRSDQTIRLCSKTKTRSGSYHLITDGWHSTERWFVYSAQIHRTRMHDLYPKVWQQNEVEIRTSSTTEQQLNRIRWVAHRQQWLLHCYFSHLTRPTRLHQCGSITQRAVWLDQARTRMWESLILLVISWKKRRRIKGGESCGRMRSMTSTLCYLADPFSFVTAREANKRFNLLSQRAQQHKSHFCTHHSSHVI